MGGVFLLASFPYSERSVGRVTRNFGDSSSEAEFAILFQCRSLLLGCACVEESLQRNRIVQCRRQLWGNRRLSQIVVPWKSVHQRNEVLGIRNPIDPKRATAPPADNANQRASPKSARRIWRSASDESLSRVCLTPHTQRRRVVTAGRERASRLGWVVWKRKKGRLTREPNEREE